MDILGIVSRVWDPHYRRSLCSFPDFRGRNVKKSTDNLSLHDEIGSPTFLVLLRGSGTRTINILVHAQISEGSEVEPVFA